MSGCPLSLAIEPSANLLEAVAVNALVTQMANVQSFAENWENVIVMAKSHPELPKEAIEDAVLVMEYKMAQAGIHVQHYHEEHDNQHWVGFKINGKLLSRARRAVVGNPPPRFARPTH